MEDGKTKVAGWCRRFAEDNGWPCERVWLQNVMTADPPDYVLCFGNTDHSVVSKARSLSITVGEVA